MSQEPPFIANFLSFLLFAACVFIFIYALLIRLNSFRKSQVSNIQPRTQVTRQPSRPSQLFIEPSPVPGENIPFPSVFDPSELQYSIIIPVYNEEERIFSLLTDVYEYFSELHNYSSENTFEVIVANNSSTDDTHDISINFCREHPEFRVLSLPSQRTLRQAISAAGLRTRGRRTLLYVPFQGIPISIFDKYLRSAPDVYETGNFVVVGRYLRNSESDSSKRSSLSLFSEYLTNLLLDIYGVKSSARNICGTVLLSREASKIIFPRLKRTLSGYDYEMLVVAKATHVKVKVVDLDIENDFSSKVKTNYRIDTLLSIIRIILLYKIGLDSVSY